MKFLLVLIGIYLYVPTQAQDKGFLPNVCFCVTSKSCGYNYGNVTMPAPPTVPTDGESVTEETTLEGEITSTSISFPDDESTPEGEQGTTQRNNRQSEKFCINTFLSCSVIKMV